VVSPIAWYRRFPGQGVQPKDVIVQIDGKSTKGMKLRMRSSSPIGPGRQHGHACDGAATISALMCPSPRARIAPRG